MTRPSTAAPILAVLAIVVGLLGLYVVGYLRLGSPVNVTTSAGPAVVRIFQYRWQAALFTPAGRGESALRRSEVEVFSNEDISQLR
jgi:hypothetical protein